MFDNGNFRRKRKRRADVSAAEGGGAPPVKSEDKRLSSPASLLSSSPPSLHGSPASTEPKSSPPPSAEHSPCFGSFVSSVNSLLGGIGERDHHQLLQQHHHQGPGATQSRETTGLGSYSPTLIPDNRMNYYSSVQSISNHFSVNNLIYTREGTEV